MDKKIVELLAPAGNYQAFTGAVNAGADAVYLGGEKFGARAYAENFSKEEILRALRYAHFNGKKVYLTLNTLIKEEEFALLYDYIRPFYESGLDGIIIQDLGVWNYIRENFSDMPLHASTQMNVTGTYGAAFLKEIGAARIVPARELSLEEIMLIKKNTGLEMECFIHGAMCYSYSGQCLFSSILGGRSGNRGRCAQPCRLGYRVSDSGIIYPLSLKDMCTIEYIPKLIEAGIDSFKIEGRMKSPEYAAGVTAVYRRYIDIYYEKGIDEYRVGRADMDRLKKLYVRSELQTGYYDRYNGAEMITLHKSGGYTGSDEALMQDISLKYLKGEKKLPVKIGGRFNAGETAKLRVEGCGITHTAYGEIVQEALGAPMTKEQILKQLVKTGSSFVYAEEESVDVGNNVFIPIAQLNKLRREAIEAFEDKVINAGKPALTANSAKKETAEEKTCLINRQTETMYGGKECHTALTNLVNDKKRPEIHVIVMKVEQLHAVCQSLCKRIYIDCDLYIKEFDRISQQNCIFDKYEIYLALPYIIRQKDDSYLKKLKSLLHKGIKGFLVRNLESLFWVFSLRENYDIVTDTGIYCFNLKTLEFLSAYGSESYLPYELNEKECRKLIDSFSIHMKPVNKKLSMTVYGTIPMMITANCIKKTTDSCKRGGEGHLLYLTDRYNKRFPVLCNCEHCYNVIYNSLPYSLHMKRKNLLKSGLFAIRLDFVSETGTEIKKILDYYCKDAAGFPVTEYTAGHYKRGVE